MTPKALSRESPEHGDCPRCGYFIIIHSSTAKCPLCPFESSWEEYNKRFPLIKFN